MTSKPTSSRIRFRQRTPWLALAGVALLALSTVGSAAANIIVPFKLPTTHEVQAAEQAETLAARAARVEALMAAGDRCLVTVSREIVHGLVYDGDAIRARAYAADHARRCGDDPEIAKWAAVKLPRRVAMK